jgi:hydroxymethylbilane synthase
MKTHAVRIASRASRLALAQAEEVAARLRAAHPGLTVELIEVGTAGDRDQATALMLMGQAGVFTKQIETELLAGRADLAVHSAKDLPSLMTAGLVIAAVPPRAPVEDVLVTGNGKSLKELSPGANVGTGSPRRAAQLLHMRSDLVATPIRGNVETRLRKLAAGEVDALLLARAGLSRLGLETRISQILDPEQFIPAAGQGFLVVQARVDDAPSRSLAATIDSEPAHRCLDAERHLMARLNVGCSAAVGALARPVGEGLNLITVALDKIGKKRLHANATVGNKGDWSRLADTVAERLIEQGVHELLGT